MAEHEQHSSFIKTPQQLLVIVLLCFIGFPVGVYGLVQLVTNRPHADPTALSDKSVSARVAPVAKVEFGEPGAAAGAPRSGDEIVKTVCGACHVPGVAGAPKIGDRAAWAPHIKRGLKEMVASAIKGTAKGMPPRGGAADLTDEELARAIVHMANQSGGSLKEPAAAKPAAKK